MAGDKDNSEDDDSALFRAALSDVSPLKQSGKRSPSRRRLPSTRPRQRERDEQEVIIALHDGSLDSEIDTGDELLFRRPGLQHGIIRKLKGGKYRIEDELDLHGLNIEGAREALADFLARCLSRGHRCVRIVHGKGIRSGAQGPVLKQRVAQWLQQRDEVLAYASTLPRHGGTGAVYVLLRRL